MMLSVCIITKNEKENLERCLKQISGYGFEIVVADTGSEDGTLQMAQRYTDCIYEFEWCGDFAKAKNFAVSKAKNNMVFVVDSDEYVRRIEIEKLKQQIVKHPKAVGRVQRVNLIRQDDEIRESREYINRLFDRRYYCYEGKIHEQLVAKDGNLYPVYDTTIIMEHSGYLLSEPQRIEKARRNIQLLEETLKENGPDPYILSQLGKSYYMINDYERASDFFSEALSFDLDPKLEYVIDAVESYGYALLNSGKADQALGLEGVYEEFGKSADFQFLMGLIYMNNEMFERAIEEFLKASRQKESRMKGVNSYLALYNAGVIYECTGNTERALEMYRSCGDYEPAQKRYKKIKG